MKSSIISSALQIRAGVGVYIAIVCKSDSNLTGIYS